MSAYDVDPISALFAVVPDGYLSLLEDWAIEAGLRRRCVAPLRRNGVPCGWIAAMDEPCGEDADHDAWQTA